MSLDSASPLHDLDQALKCLEAEGLLRVEYGSVSVLDLARLRTYGE